MASKAATRDGPYVSIGLKIFTVAVVILALMCAVTALTVHMAASVNRELQVLGGWGYCTEYKVERFLRDAKLLEIGGGTLESHQKNITKELMRQVTQG